MAKKQTKTLKLDNIKSGDKSDVKKREVKVKLPTLEEQLNSTKKPELVEMYINLDEVNKAQAKSLDTAQTRNRQLATTVKDQDQVIIALKNDVSALKNTNKQLKTNAQEEIIKCKKLERKNQDLTVDLKDFKEMSVLKFLVYAFKR